MRSVPHTIRLVLVMLLCLPALVGCSRSLASPSGPAGTAFEPSAYPGGDLLVTAAWLDQHRDDPGLRIIDLSELRDYRAGHIPGATHIWWQDTIEVHNDVYGMMVGSDGVARLIHDAGITEDTTVVLYDGSGDRYAARFLWLLHAVGFSRAMLLNGGRQAWQAAGLPLTQQAPSVTPGSLTQHLDYDVLISYDDVEPRLSDGTLAIVDNRTPDEQRDTWFGRLRVGRIPGAAMIPWTDLTQTGAVPYYADPAALRQRFLDAGVTPDKTVIVYGIDGVATAQTYVALRLLGYPSVKVYDGSWAEWGARADLPIEPLPGAATGDVPHR